MSDILVGPTLVCVSVRPLFVRPSRGQVVRCGANICFCTVEHRCVK